MMCLWISFMCVKTATFQLFWVSPAEYAPFFNFKIEFTMHNVVNFKKIHAETAKLSPKLRSWTWKSVWQRNPLLIAHIWDLWWNGHNRICKDPSEELYKPNVNNFGFYKQIPGSSWSHPHLLFKGTTETASCYLLRILQQWLLVSTSSLLLVNRGNKKWRGKHSEVSCPSQSS